MNDKTFISVTAGFLGADSGTTGGDYYHGIRRSFATSNIGYLDVPLDLQHAANYTDNNSNSFTVKDNYNRFNVSGDVTRYANWRGQHAFKAGFQYERLGNDVNQGQQFPNVTLNWNQTRTTLDQPAGSRHLRLLLDRADVHVRQHQVEQHGPVPAGSVVVQRQADDQLWRAIRQHEIPVVPSENPGIEFGWGDKVAPRLGFAYDVKGDGKWKTYGSWGIFYDIEKLELPRGAWGAENWVDVLLDAGQLQLAQRQLRRLAELRLSGHVHRAE